MKRDPLLIDGLVVLIFTMIGLVLGFRPLLDLDLGWHLAGGLWMLEHGSVPTLDPLGAQAAPWVAYSWLFEVIAALIYKAEGFRGLQFAQAAAILASIWLMLRLNFDAVRENLPNDQLGYRLSWTLASFVVLFFVAPIWHLRPQLVSVVLFIVLLIRAERGELTLRAIALLGLLWANLHVYWVFLPLVVFLYRVLTQLVAVDLKAAARGLLLTLFAVSIGLVNPYGAQMLPVLRQYAFSHQVATSLITEFQPLGQGQGLIFWIYLCVLVSMLLRLVPILKRDGTTLLPLAVLFAVLSAKQIKYLPLFGVVSGVLLAREIIPALLRLVRYPRKKITHESGLAMPFEHQVLAGLLLLFMSMFCGLIFQLPPALPPKIEELIELGRELKDILPPEFIQAGKTHAVLNHFDDGGWLALVFWLNRPQGSSESVLKTTIDGRTPVMGATRLEEFNRLRAGGEDWCEIVKRWNPEVAILPNKLALTGALNNGKWSDSSETRCSKRWKTIYPGKLWEVMRPSS